jgi:hypothetical protein
MYPKIFFANSQLNPQAGNCFVIMPFAQEFDEVYETIREVMESRELNFNCFRADELQGGGHIILDILTRIAQAEIIIADLTGMNPNVFYELGIAQMVKDVEKVFLLSQDLASIPFDVRIFRCIEYKQSIQGAKELKDRLRTGVEAVAEKQFRFNIHQGVDYEFQERLIGPDLRAYDFAISESFFPFEAAKFRLRMNRYVVGKPPAISFDRSEALKVGEIYKLPSLEWDLKLERVVGDVAAFVVQRRAVEKGGPTPARDPLTSTGRTRPSTKSRRAAVAVPKPRAKKPRTPKRPRR